MAKYPQNSEENQRMNHYEEETADDEISLIDIARTIWQGKGFIIKVVIVFFALGLLIAFGSQKEYESTSTIMPEATSAQGGASGLLQQFGGLAGLSGMGGSLGQNASTIPPQLYPKIVQSTPFLLHLMKQKVYFADIDSTVTVFNYFDSLKSNSLVGFLKLYTIGLPGKIKSLVKSESHLTTNDTSSIDSLGYESIIKLSSEEQSVVSTLRERILIETETETGVITLTMKIPDARASSAIAQLTLNYIKEYVTNYKTEKSRQELKFIKARYADAQDRFNAAQRNLAVFRDQHTNIVTQQAQINDQRLQQEFSLASNIYNSLAERLEQAKISVQEETPVFKILEPVQVPLDNVSSQKTVIMIIFTFSGMAIGIFIVLIKKASKRFNYIFS